MICDKMKCTGCFACYNICPQKAITMKPDSLGNIYPEINKEKCINCNLCKKICPQLKEKLNFHNPLATYAMYNKDQQKRKESTSGGAAATFYEKILNNDGIIYGVSNLFGESSFKFIRVDKLEELYKVKGSKYVHAYVGDAFKLIKQDLEGNKKVLFIGTPCQVSGLYSYLMKDSDNLITTDIICHGVPSQQLLFDEIKEHNINTKDIQYVFFRDKNVFNFSIVDKNNNIVFSEVANLVPYYRNFLKGNIYRENCYSCRYAYGERVADITIGDFWGLSKESKVYDSESKGISVIIVNTEKGRKLINSVWEECIIEERTFEEASASNGQLNSPIKKSKAYDMYVKNYNILGYKKTMNKMLSTKEKLKIIILKNKVVYKVLKNIKNIIFVR